MFGNFKLSETITIPKDMKVRVDEKTLAQSIDFPFRFPTLENGILVLIYINAAPWEPYKTISNVQINYANQTA